MTRQVTLAGAIWALGAAVTCAQPAGLSDAVNLWLSGKDEASIRALAADAAAGDVSAQMLLGQIDRDTIAGAHSDFVLSIRGKGRAPLLRADNGERSINWLLKLSDPSKADLAQAIFWYKANLDPIDAALDLARNGEKRAAEYVLWDTLNNGRFDLVNALPEQNYGLAEAGFLTWIRDYFAGPNKAITINGFLADTNPEKVEGLLALKRLERLLGLKDYFSVGVNELITVVRGNGYDLPDTADLITLNSNLARVAEVDPAIGVALRFCSQCPRTDVDYDCMVQTFEVIGGYKTLMSVRTPVENVVPAATYITSDRAVETLKTLVKGRAAIYNRPIRSSCIAGMISGEF